MKHERTHNQKQKPYPVNPQARPDYRPDQGDDDEHLPGQRQPPIEAQESGEGSGNRAVRDTQTQEDIQRAEQEGMVKDKEGNRAEGSDRKSSRRQQGNTSRKN